VMRTTITMTIPRYRLDLSVLSVYSTYAMKHKMPPTQSI